MDIHKTKIFLVSSFLVLVSYCSSQIIKKQDSIPIDNSTGVPHWTIGSGGVPISGFDVDSAGNYYFVGGNYRQRTTILAVFNGNKEKYRKVYDTHFPDKIFIHHSKIYLFNSYRLNMPNVKSNTLYELDIKDGEILKKYPHLFNDQVWEYHYVDGLIILALSDTTSLHHPYDSYYTVLNLKGKLIGRAKNQNIYDLPDSLKLKQYLGRWNKLLLFCNYDIKDSDPIGSGKYKFYFKDTNGKSLCVATIDNKVTGWAFPEDTGHEEVYIELRNGSIYMFGKKDSANAIITELSVEELYKDALQHPVTNMQ